MPDTFTNVINPNVPGLDTALSTGQRVTTRASTFLFSASQGAIIASLLDPFGSGSTFATVGVVPAQLALSGNNVVKGAGVAVAGAEYRMKVLATSSDGQRETSAILSFTAKSEAPPVVVTPTPSPTPTPTPSPTIAFASTTASVAEGDSGTKTVSNVINVTRNGVTGPLTVNLSYSGTATSGVDYVAGPVSGTIADGQTSLSFDLTINGDTGVESDETIVINAVLDAYSSATASKTINVTNDDVAPYTVLFVGSSTPARYFKNDTGPANSQVSYSQNGTTFTPSTGVGAGAANFGDILQKALNRPIRLIDTGAGGTTTADWEASGSTLRSNAITAALAAGGVNAIVSIVGFNDVYLNNGATVTTQAAQNTRLRSFLSKLRTELSAANVPIFIGGTQLYNGSDSVASDDKFTIVRAAELTVVNDANNYFYGHAYDLAQESDGIHQNGASYLIHSARGAANFLALLQGGAFEKGPRVTGASAVYTTKVRVTLAHSTGSDFTPTTAITGFQVTYDGGTTYLTPSAAVRVDATTVDLTLGSANTAAPAVVAFAGKTQPRTGVLKDNSVRALPINPTIAPVVAASGTTTADPGGIPVTAKSAKLNFTGTPASNPAAYNAITGPAEASGGQAGTTGNVVALKQPDGSASGWTFTATTGSQGSNAGGVNTGNNSGAVPDAVLSTFWFNGDTTTGGTRVASTTHTITGLNPAKTYSLSFLGSRTGSTARSTTYAAGGQSVTQNNLVNSSTISTLSGLVPDGSGALVYTYTPAGTGAFGYINYLEVIESV